MFGTSSAAVIGDVTDDWAHHFHAHHSYPAGIELFAQGSLLHEVYWLAEGLVKLVYVDEDGRERILDLRVPGQLIGAALVFLRLPSPVSAVTVTRCRLQYMSDVEFARRVESDERLSWKVHEIQGLEVYGQFQRMAELSTGSSRLRLERFLSQIAQACPALTNGRFQLPLKRCELAQLLAVTPEHLSRLFKRLCEEGVIAFEKGWLKIRDARRLASTSPAVAPRTWLEGHSTNRLSA
jgi:CRP/FNR family transcriptional regulator